MDKNIDKNKAILKNSKNEWKTEIISWETIQKVECQKLLWTRFPADFFTKRNHTKHTSITCIRGIDLWVTLNDGLMWDSRMSL